MKELWTLKSKYDHWLRVELALLQAKANRGEIPVPIYEVFREHAKFTVERIGELDAVIEHDMIAFIQTVQESIAAAGFPNLQGEFHKNSTSYDIEDPGAMLQLRESAQLIVTALKELREVLYEQALKNKDVLMIARTHGQLAEPDSFGRLLLDFVEAYDQDIRRLRYIIENELSYAKMSGAIGSYGGIDPELEKEALALLGLRPVRVSTQILGRDRHATYINELAIIGGTSERLAETLWIMSHGLIAEVREPRVAKQKGSSAMPHKINPILIERMMGMSRLLRGCAVSMMESIATPECRDISQSCVERVVFPDSTSIAYYMLEKLTKVIKSLEVFPETMRENLERAYGTSAGQRLKIALIDAGVNQEIAYRHVQKQSGIAIATRTHLRDLMKTTPIPELEEGPTESRTAADIIGEKFDQLFDDEYYIKKGVEEIFKRFRGVWA